MHDRSRWSKKYIFLAEEKLVLQLDSKFRILYEWPNCWRIQRNLKQLQIIEYGNKI